MKKTVYMFIAVLIIGSGLVDWQKVSAESASQKIDELEEKQNELDDKKSNLNSKKNNTEEKIEDNLNKQESVGNDIDAINQQLSETRNKIKSKESEITATNNEIKDLEKQIKEINQKIDQLKEEIKAMRERIKEREKMLKDRLRAIQSNGGNMKYMEVILGSRNFGDFISRTSAVNTIMDQDKNIMEEHMAEKKLMEEKKVEVEQKKDEIEQKKAEVEEKKASLVNQKSELESLKSTLDDQAAEKEKLMAELEEEHNHLEEYKMSLAEQKQVLNDQAAVIEKAKKSALAQLAKEKNKNSSSSGASLSAGGSGIFSWPSQGRLSSTYGSRSLGYHYGLDIAASTGTTIKTAAAGVVTRSAYSTSYGNVVYVYHPQYNKSTVYAHMSSRSVGYGQNVSAGQKLGEIGNTGRSYGAHLHFEVHNGEWSQHGGINPMPFLK
ncbi:N-terminal domain of peptidoglycan hydrolase CwlO-containing protein [Virgibacillus subterraneus]|uniref:N-terminal domain of peptidoglycan hydrolase CwlO-containing protein n=1 Tax=Virgibacillus subterraneus TaxID=621109 RepID=A0A1H9BS75_9BACI|nr:M23 family metallopeptidase [Virgibacillus subterraneus]SEP91218.1 N-terminal domain of peptidoglycan hydrolase CwlO-containing protein [Virgibacillus subterraneus]